MDDVNLYHHHHLSSLTKDYFLFTQSLIPNRRAAFYVFIQRSRLLVAYGSVFLYGLEVLC